MEENRKQKNQGTDIDKTALWSGSMVCRVHPGGLDRKSRESLCIPDLHTHEMRDIADSLPQTLANIIRLNDEIVMFGEQEWCGAARPIQPQSGVESRRMDRFGSLVVKPNSRYQELRIPLILDSAGLCQVDKRKCSEKAGHSARWLLIYPKDFGPIP